ncbi:PRC-barrel domain-containing protein [Streptomyces flavidovirens]|uniref:PRC-barrel domain-containing protein n=1 Tax=Streptomyces flavidovirens TaxID=67298 RepID=UPI00040CCB82|nr:PRC-barrel domain-containing protein [Streptomyces flavidovirens]
MLLSQAVGRPVVNVTTAETIGTVTGCFVSGRPARITALHLNTRGHGGHILTWDNVRSFGQDAVIIRSMEKLRPDKHIDSQDPAHPSHDPIGKPVLTETGELHGTVEDIDFDQQTGHIQRLVATEGDMPGETLLGSGSYAVVTSTTT